MERLNATEIDFKNLLRRCDGVLEKKIEQKDYMHRVKYYHKFFLIGEKIVPNGDDIYVEIKATATQGTIGRLIEVVPLTYGDENQISEYNAGFILEVDGRKQPVKIRQQHANIFVAYPGHKIETVYERNVKTHEKVEIKNPVNKFKQELQAGDWVIGVAKGSKRLGVGRVTRWTNHNVWGVRGDNLDDKSKEFQFDSIKETFLIRSDEQLAELTMALLKGWDGR